MKSLVRLCVGHRVMSGIKPGGQNRNKEPRETFRAHLDPISAVDTTVTIRTRVRDVNALPTWDFEILHCSPQGPIYLAAM